LSVLGNYFISHENWTYTPKRGRMIAYLTELLMCDQCKPE